MKKNSGRLFLLTAIFVTLAFTYALAFESLHAHHDCAGESCPLCCVIHFLKLSLSSLLLLTFSGKGLFLFRKYFEKEIYLLCYKRSETLVSNKIKLND